MIDDQACLQKCKEDLGSKGTQIYKYVRKTHGFGVGG